ncbi:radical SAM protein [Patescibacteria group bacterium]|nr:radical SAM protein [Patescibacteria group bacterium]
MTKYWLGKAVALLAIVGLLSSTVTVESSATITQRDPSARGSETYVVFPNGRTIALKQGERITITKPCTAMYRSESGWLDVPVKPKQHIVFNKTCAYREESVAAMLLPFGTKRRTIMLNYPPASSVWHLPSGIAQLTGVLQAQGHDVTQRYGHITGLEYLLRQHGGTEIERALAAVRDPQSDIFALHDARMTFERVSSNIPTNDRFVVERNNVTYVSRYYDGTIEGALEAVKNRESHLWYRYFADVEIPLALSARPDLYGISVADERQFIQGIILASMVKDAIPGCKVVLGGNFWSRVTHAFTHPAFAKFFSFCDAIVYREGYQPLAELAAGLDPSRASGTAWWNGSDVVVNPATVTPASFETLPTPVFDASVRQWSPDTVYSLYTASNCYMACEFCAIPAGSDTYLGKPRTMSPRRIAEQMQALGGSRFEIFDEMLPIPNQLALGRELKRIGHSATWECYLTMSNKLMDPAVCSQLYDAGCRAVQVGLESLSPDTLAQENKKWNTPSNYGVILRNLRNAGIQTHAFLIVGIPGEPLHYGLAWTAFLEKYGEDILTIKSGRYRLTRNSPEERGGNRNECIEVSADTKPLHLNRDFTYRLSSRKKVEATRDLLEQACRQHWAYGVTSTIPWWVNRGRYSWDELRQMAHLLPQEPEVRHLDRAVTRANTIAKEELGFSGQLKTFDDVVAFSRTLV